MTTVEKVAELHAQGYNCCQSVLCQLEEYTGLPNKKALSLCTSFGGGIRCGSVCGAVLGGLMAIGCACMESEDLEADTEASTVWTQELEEIFTRRTGTLMHDDIIREHDYDICDELIAEMVNTAEKIIRREKHLDD